jgi:Zn-dependent membrane protease YugP
VDDRREKQTMFYISPLYLMIMLPVMALTMWAQWRLRSVFSRYSEVRNMQGWTGARAARALLDSQGLNDVRIERLNSGEALDNHYDPRDRTLRLSPQVSDSQSVAALGVAAHECGHAVQHAQGYQLLQLRTALVPAANFGSNIGVWLVMIGFILAGWMHISGMVWLVWAGIALFSLAALFALITLPVELNASSRAMTLLQNTGLIDRTEYDQSKQVLNAAAWTYVAGLAAAVGTLFYYVMAALGMSGRRS